ncbi:hypothetical protein [Exiguobacterium sp. ERU656]|uniref:hypothetical protein n=1 Tax=Exiguobacterium sp. ERU656 TaxID=2751217 RepID=UPI001BEBD20C|nr:hypothetical protein [Exiguobacterium sp. ERU656]
MYGEANKHSTVIKNLNQEFLRELEKKFDNSISEEFYKKISLKFQQNFNDSTTPKFEELWVEVKKFYLMKYISPNTPMFSQDVDEIWHIMILFTRNYEEFTRRFYGEMLHHDPNLTPHVDVKSRSWFEWLYLNMFTLDKFSWKIWGGFLRVNIHDEFQKKSDKELFFNDMMRSSLKSGVASKKFIDFLYLKLTN